MKITKSFPLAKSSDRFSVSNIIARISFIRENPEIYDLTSLTYTYLRYDCVSDAASMLRLLRGADVSCYRKDSTIYINL